MGNDVFTCFETLSYASIKLSYALAQIIWLMILVCIIMLLQYVILCLHYDDLDYASGLYYYASLAMITVYITIMLL